MGSKNFYKNVKKNKTLLQEQCKKNWPISCGSSWQNTAIEVLIPPVMLLENAAPTASPSLKLWIPSPRITIQAMAVTVLGMVLQRLWEWPWEKSSTLLWESSSSPGWLCLPSTLFWSSALSDIKSLHSPLWDSTA